MRDPREPEAVIIGGGPAGLAAGMHLARAGYATTLLEQDRLGGQARRVDWIENYPGFPAGVRGRDLMARWSAQARRWGLELRRARALRVSPKNGRFEVALEAGEKLRCRAVLCCAGAEFKRLGVPGEDALWGRGVGHAPFERAARSRGKDVAVVGSGEAAVHQALLLSRFARRVYVLGRGPGLKTHRLLAGRAASRANLVHLPDTAVERLEGSVRLEGVWARGKAGGRRLEVSELFVLIGKRKPASLLAGDRKKTPGYFVAGDAGGGCRQVVVAAGKGVEAAMGCIRHLEGWRGT